MNQFETKMDYLGYDKKVGKINVRKGYEPLIRLLGQLNSNQVMALAPVSLEEAKKEAVAFYSKYFSVHDIKKVLMEDLRGIQKKVQLGDITGIEAYKQYFQLLKEVSPFDLPVKLVEGHSMIGEIKKALMIIPKEFIPENTGVMIPFVNIELGKELDELSSSTYVHEIAHTQQESHPGYAKSYLNKEVISIFLEKLSALEKDPTGKLLLMSERKRFLYLANVISTLYLNGTKYHLSEEETIEYMMYIHSTLIAEKLFDLYLKERKPKRKDAFIYDIQDIFDGKQTVEDMLDKRYVKFSQGMDLNLIKRHM